MWLIMGDKMYDFLPFPINTVLTDRDASELEQTKLYSDVDKLVQSIVSSCSIIGYSMCKIEITKIVKILISQNKDSMAHDILDYFRAEMVSQQYHHWNPSVRKFIKELDFTDIFHNLAVLTLAKKDYDRALYYFASAGEEYSKHNEVDILAYSMMQLSTPNMPFGHVVSHICRNCSGMGMFRPYEYNAFFDDDLKPQHFIELLGLFSPSQLYQFILTNIRFWDLLSLQHNRVKGLIMVRLLGELSWLFESFLRAITTEATLSLSLKKFLSVDNVIRDKYDALHALKRKFGHHENCDSEILKEVMSRFEKAVNLQDKSALSLYATYFMRNHTSHNLDEGFLLFNDDTFTKKLYMLELAAFFVAKHLMVKYMRE